MGFVLLISWDYVAHAFARKEVSAEPGGLPWVYWLKGLILVFAMQMILQALLQALRAWRRWRESDAS